jgi:hypothetical protein
MNLTFCYFLLDDYLGIFAGSVLIFVYGFPAFLALMPDQPGERSSPQSAVVLG